MKKPTIRTGKAKARSKPGSKAPAKPRAKATRGGVAKWNRLALVGVGR